MTQTGVMAGGRLTDWISLGVLASWVPADAVDGAIEATGRQVQRRGGKLPPRVTAYLVMALALFADEDYEEVATRLAASGCDDRHHVNLLPRADGTLRSPPSSAVQKQEEISQCRRR